MTTVSHPPRKGYRTIRLPLGELEYDRFIENRTSNLVDRLMKCLDRACLTGQYFHGTFESAESRVRAWGYGGTSVPRLPLR
jgi:hypothetical protein